MSEELFGNRADRIDAYRLLAHEYGVFLDNNWLYDHSFFVAPASTKYHGNYEGGLFDHSYTVCKELLWMTTALGLEWKRRESPFIVGMFHDLCKCDQYNVTALPDYHTAFRIEHNDETLLKGHGEKSIMMLSQIMTLTDEEVMCIRYHMGAYNTDEWPELARAIKAYPNVLYTHTADMIASHIKGI